MADKLSISVLSRLGNVSEVCSSARGFYKSKKVDDKICDSLEIAITEAMNNIIEHAYEKKENRPIELLFAYEGNKISIRIVDYGKPRSNTGKAELEFDPADIESLPERGMGLYLIEKIMDRTFYETKDGKNIYKLEKSVPDK